MLLRILTLVSLSVFASTAAESCIIPTGAVLRVALAPGSPRSAKPNAVLTGSIRQPVYAGPCRALPAESKVRAVVEGTGLKVEIGPVAFRGSVVRFAKQKHAAAAAKPGPTERVLLLRVDEPVAAAGTLLPTVERGTIAAGTQVRVALESAVGSKRSKTGDPVRAVLLEPILSDGNVLVPPGTVVHGTLAAAKRARRPYRAGGVRISFQSLDVAANRAVSVPLAISAGELAGGARVDGEGGVTGSALTKKRALINLGIAYATGKILDDVIEESAKAALTAAVAGSAETAARYVGLAAGTAVFLLHRGREVQLEPHTELTLSFSRAIEMRPDPPSATSVSRPPVEPAAPLR
jgi:hypothetical protein